MQNKNNLNNVEQPLKAGTQPAGFVLPPRPQQAQTNTDKKKQNNKKQKTNKEKKEKKELTPKQKQKIKKMAIILSAAFVLVVAIIIAASVIIGNIKQNAPLVIGTGQEEINLVKIDEEFFLVTPYHSEAEVYFFEIKKQGQPDSQIVEIESANNAISVSGIFSDAGIYQVRLAVSKNNRPSTKSVFTSWANITATQKLETPNFNYNPETKMFSWQEVNNASAYKLYYFENEQLKTVTIENPTATNGIISKSIDSLGLELGVYEFTLIAVNEAESYYIPSDYNQKILVNHFEKLEAIVSGNYDVPTNTLTVELAQFRSDLRLKISYGNNQSITVNFNLNATSHSFLLSDYNGLSFNVNNNIEVSLVSVQNFVAESEKIAVTLSN